MMVGVALILKRSKTAFPSGSWLVAWKRMKFLVRKG
jgi:hypothetical protein